MGGSLIVLDMIKKIDVRITHKHYSLENGIFTLQIDVGDYDLTNKTITAKFNPKEVETGHLDVIDGIINLPIYSNLLEYGANYIQLNFRWDENKLEQSPMIMWNISHSLAATEAAQEDVDIISYLINEIQAAKATADRMIEDAGDVRIELDESTVSATAINNTLADPVTGTIKLATDANATLSQSIIDAGIADGALTDPVTGAIVLAEAAEDALTNPITGAIKLAEDAEDALTNPITGAIKLAEDAKSDIEQAIIDNEIVTQTEFDDLAGTGRTAETVKKNADDIATLNSAKVDKVEGKGLSANDYTTTEKNKLGAIQAEANKTIIANNLTETVTGKALDATQGKALDDKIGVLNNLTTTEKTSLTGAVSEVKNELVAHKEDYATQRQQDQFKVATVEKGLNDYKSTMANVNINQEAKQSVSGYGIISLPPNAANGQVSEIVVKGRTLKNELNYNPETYAEWATYTGVQKSSEGLLFETSTTTARQVTLRTNLKLSTTYGMLYDVAESTVSQFVLWQGMFSSNEYMPKNVGHNKIVMTTRSISEYNRITIGIYKNTEDTTVLKVKNLRMFELPAGSEIEADFNTLTADQLAAKYPYINGDSAKSTVSASRIKSVGVNLLNERLINYSNPNFVELLPDGTISFKSSSEPGGLTTQTGIITLKTDSVRRTEAELKKLIKIKEGYRYYFRCLEPSKVDNIFSAMILGEDGKHVERHYNISSGGSVVIASGKGAKYLEPNRQLSAFTCKGIIISEEINHSYEPYAESNAYLPNVGELRSLPNGTKDEVNLTTGVKTQRVMPHIVSSVGLYTSYDEVDLVYVSLQNMKLNNNAYATSGLILVENMQEVRWSDRQQIGSIGKFTIQPEVARVWFVVEKNAYTQQQAIEAFAGTSLTYQLATPIVTPIEVSGTLLSYPSGTVYIERVIADAGLYNNGIATQYTTLPIKSVDKIIKYNFSTGVQTSLDVSKAVINANKLSFTHPDLANGDMVFFDYFYDMESTEAETEIEYYDSRHTIKDTTNNKYYSWKITSTDGVPTVVLSEVL